MPGYTDDEPLPEILGPGEVFVPGDIAPSDMNPYDTTVDAEITKTEARGYTLVEALEHTGLLRPGDEVSDTPWEI